MELFSLTKGGSGRRNSYTAEELLLIEEARSKGGTPKTIGPWLQATCLEQFGVTTKVRSEASLGYVLTRKYQEFVHALHTEHLAREKAGTTDEVQEEIYERMLKARSSRIEMCKLFIEVNKVPSIKPTGQETL